MRCSALMIARVMSLSIARNVLRPLLSLPDTCQPLSAFEYVIYILFIVLVDNCERYKARHKEPYNPY